MDRGLVFGEEDKDLYEIKFAKNFIKLHNQTHAELIDVRTIDLSLLSDIEFQELIEIDAKAEDGSYFPLDRNSQYVLLIFLGNKNIPFTTLRKISSYEKYVQLINHIFDIRVISE